MSLSTPLSTLLTQPRVTKISLLILSGAGALAVASAVIPSTGAWFFEQQAGRVIATTGGMGFTVLDSQGAQSTGPFELRFDGLAPGVPKTQTFTVKNTGSLTGTLDMTFSGLTISGGDNPNLSQLSYSVDGATPFALLQGRRTSLYVGTIAPGAAKEIKVTLTLAEDAGPEWQNVSASNALDFMLSQAH